jgi:hypothetical protein
MRQAEADWANLAVKKNPAVLDRILAADYVGVSSENVVRDKKQYLKDESGEEPSGKFVSSKLDYVNYRHFGDTVLAQGAESIKRADGSPDLRLIWTDVWMWRDGKWQVQPAPGKEPPSQDDLNRWVDAWRLASSLLTQPANARTAATEWIEVRLAEGGTLRLGIVQRAPQLVLLRPDEQLTFHFSEEMSERLLSPPVAPEAATAPASGTQPAAPAQ